MNNEIALVTAVNDDNILRRCLLASDLDHTNNRFIALRHYPSAAIAYNYGMSQSASSIVVFAHQDVYIPRGWFARFFQALDWLSDKRWAVLGIIGKTQQGHVVGRTWSTGIGKEVGCLVQTPIIVESIDELLFAVNRKSDLTFDERLPGFHLYGTDIVQIAKKAGYDSYVFDGPVIHNSLPVLKLDQYFCQGYSYLQNKWHDRLPLDTLTVPITRYGWPLLTWRLKSLLRVTRSRNMVKRLADPPAKARQLGYE